MLILTSKAIKDFRIWQLRREKYLANGSWRSAIQMIYRTMLCFAIVDISILYNTLIYITYIWNLMAALPIGSNFVSKPSRDILKHTQRIPQSRSTRFGALKSYTYTHPLNKCIHIKIKVNKYMSKYVMFFRSYNTFTAFKFHKLFPMLCILRII